MTYPWFLKPWPASPSRLHLPRYTWKYPMKCQNSHFQNSMVFLWFSHQITIKSQCSHGLWFSHQITISLWFSHKITMVSWGISTSSRQNNRLEGWSSLSLAVSGRLSSCLSTLHDCICWISSPLCFLVILCARAGRGNEGSEAVKHRGNHWNHGWFGN